MWSCLHILRSKIITVQLCKGAAASVSDVSRAVVGADVRRGMRWRENALKSHCGPCLPSQSFCPSASVGAQKCAWVACFDYYANISVTLLVPLLNPLLHQPLPLPLHLKTESVGVVVKIYLHGMGRPLRENVTSSVVCDGVVFLLEIQHAVLSQLLLCRLCGL